eukprot:TRINITY_DN15615_c0_g1_i2.p1 TRINITY_DN15615_c0_g1~~TRINITY_DN15615_c0_g1_i2.p1  ORF type:complete len:369 (+),score=105.72 TRINITY_DN15615_c0_g1_i2:843-1949(+)
MPPQTYSFDGPTCNDISNTSTASKDLYGVLGLGREATATAIRKSFLVLAKKYHPDKQSNPDLVPEATTQFQRVRHAFNVLNNPQSKSLYDMQLAVRQPRTVSNPSNQGTASAGSGAGAGQWSTGTQANLNASSPFATYSAAPSKAWTEEEKDAFYNIIAHGGVCYDKLVKAIPTQSLSEIRRFYFHAVNAATEFARVHRSERSVVSDSIEDTLMAHRTYLKTGKVPGATTPPTPPAAPSSKVAEPVPSASPDAPPPPPEPIFPEYVKSSSSTTGTTSNSPTANASEHSAPPPESRPKAAKSKPGVPPKRPGSSEAKAEKMRRVLEARARLAATRRSLGLKVKRAKPGTQGAPGRPRKVPLAKVPVSAL